MLHILYLLWEMLSDTVLSLVDSRKSKGFNAEFGKETLIANRFNKGILISRNRRLSRRLSYENLLITGPTGSGKTSKLLIKNTLLLKNCSMVINDPNGEIAHHCMPSLSKYFSIKTLDFSNAAASSGFPILRKIKKPNDMHKISDLLTRTTIGKNNSDPFWTLSVNSLLVMCIKLVLTWPEEYQNLSNVLHIITTYGSNPQKVDEWFVNSGDEELISQYKSFVATPERTLLNIISSAKACLQMFEDPEISKVTGTIYDEIDFHILRKKPTVIFLHNTVDAQKYLNVLIGIFFEFLYSSILQKLPKKKDLPIFIILEEASSIYCPVLPVAVANTRKAKVSNIICVQALSQLQTLYGASARDIVSNCVTKLFLPGIADMETLREIEQLSGKSTYTDKKGIERSKPLATVDEIRQLPRQRTLILSGNFPLIKGRTSYFFKSFKFKKLTRRPPISFKSEIPDTPIPLMK